VFVNARKIQSSAPRVPSVDERVDERGHRVGLGTIHTVRSEHGRRNILEGAQAPLAGRTRQARSGRDGRVQAERLQPEHVIHSEDGTIAERHSHGTNWTRMAG
jgi:hypothetical protein